MHCRPAICSHSLGRAWVHDLPAKLDAAARHGLDIELFYEDMEYVAKSLHGGLTDANKIRAAQIVRSWCDARGLRIMSLQPFMHYDGLKDRVRHAERVTEMRLWFILAKVLGTNLISIPSTFLPATETSGDIDLIVSDMQEIADMGAPHDMQFAYEALCWGTHTSTWERSWTVVERVNRDNFGICLDTFNIAGKIYADPARPSGKNPNAERELKASLERMVKRIDVRKIAYVQVVDAERLAKPLDKSHEYYDPEQPSRMSWSRNCRLFYGEHDRGAYLPIHAILKTILVDLGFEGYISAEVFNRDLTDPSPNTPEDLAWRAEVSWHKIVDDFNLDDSPLPTVYASQTLVDQVPRAQL